MHVINRLQRKTGSGIGRSCVAGLAREGAAGILVADIDLTAADSVVAECKAVAAHGGFRAESFRVDVTVEESVKALLDHAVLIFGRVDYCVNCAGVCVCDV